MTGLCDGSLVHYDVERGEVCHETPSSSSPHRGTAVQHLSWVEPDGATEAPGNSGAKKGQQVRRSEGRWSSPLQTSA